MEVPNSGPESQSSTPLHLLSQSGNARLNLSDQDLIEHYLTSPFSNTQGWVRANFVATLDGRISGDGGVSAAISSPGDKRVFAVLRAVADAVVVGAQTVRAERYTRLPIRARFQSLRESRGQAQAPALVIVSASGDVDVNHINSAAGGSVLIHTTTTCVDTVGKLREAFGEDCVIVHRQAIKAAGILTDLRARGLNHVLCEGGPQLFSQWLDEGAIDELDLTRSGLVVGGPTAGNTLIGEAPLSTPSAFRLGSIISDGENLMQRWFRH